MGSNNYAEHVVTSKSREEILAEIRKVRVFHLATTESTAQMWGYGGMDFPWLEYSGFVVNIDVVEVLFENNAVYEVDFGNALRGWCVEANQKHFWIAKHVREPQESAVVENTVSRADDGTVSTGEDIPF